MKQHPFGYPPMFWPPTFWPPMRILRLVTSSADFLGQPRFRRCPNPADLPWPAWRLAHSRSNRDPVKPAERSSSLMLRGVPGNFHWVSWCFILGPNVARASDFDGLLCCRLRQPVSGCPWSRPLTIWPSDPDWPSWQIVVPPQPRSTRCLH